MCKNKSSRVKGSRRFCEQVQLRHGQVQGKEARHEDDEVGFTLRYFENPRCKGRSSRAMCRVWRHNGSQMVDRKVELKLAPVQQCCIIIQL